MTARVRGALALAAVLFAALAGLALDAGARRERGRPAHRVRSALVVATASADLALSSGARWLRHPIAAEPAAGCVGPTCLDVDPAGLALPPARSTFAGGRTLFRVPPP
jgi:hypothetical protein